MGLLDKMKNLFTEEVEEEPVKSEVIKVEIPAPVKKEEVKKEEIKEEVVTIKPKEEVKKEEIKEDKSPIFFDDSYFKELDAKKEIKRDIKSSYLKDVKEKKEDKHFKPTPIISPVYGVLDKNYTKEDITDKKENNVHNSNVTNIDDVRKKAYGTLADDIETTLFKSNSILFNEETDDDKEILDELIDIEDDNNVEMTDDSNLLDDLKESDTELFDLIDTMYEGDNNND